MEGTTLTQGPLRPIPLHCQRTVAPSLDARLFQFPPPTALDLRLPWKAPVLSGADKLPPCLLTPVPSPIHPLALLQQLRNHHILTSERLRPDVILPKSIPDVILPKAPMTSPVPALPTPSVIPGLGLPLPVLGTAAGATTVVDRMGGGGGSVVGGGRGGGAQKAGRGAEEGRAAGGSPGLNSMVMSPDVTGTSPYGRKLFLCPQCRYTTDRRNNLKRHMLTMHQLSAKLLECCGLLFRTKAALREHALVFHYHGYTCFYCARRFCRKALLKRHLSVHNGQKEFLCNVCDYATSHKSNLERHRRVHGRPEDEDDVTTDGAFRRDDAEPLSDDVKSNVSGSNSNVDVSCDELSVCSDDEDEEINVQSD